LERFHRKWVYFLQVIALFVCFILLGDIAEAKLSTNIAPENPISSSFWGLHIHRAGFSTPWPDVSFGSWRLWDAYEVWPCLEPNKGEWRFNNLDKFIAMAEKNRVGVLLPLGLSPAWVSARLKEKRAYSPGISAESRNLEDWTNYVRMVATRYKGRVQYYELWNEPNLKSFY
jgi:hypothetical protein